MRKSPIALALSAVLAATSLSGAALAGDEVQAKRVVYVCDSSDATARSFEREFGEQTFVTADEAMKAAREDVAWSAPKCMTAAEAGKLAAALEERERAILTARAEN